MNSYALRGVSIKYVPPIFVLEILNPSAERWTTYILPLLPHMCKGCGTNARVCSFIPVRDLPYQTPHKFDAILDQGARRVIYQML